MHAVSAVALTAVALVLAACSKGDQVTVRAVNLHAPASCPVASGSFGEYTATGDFPFDPSTTTSTPLNLSQVGAVLAGIPADVRSLALLANSQTDLITGVTLVPPSGDVDLLVLPTARACALSANVGFVPGTPSAGGLLSPDMIAGAADAHTMLVLGSDKLPATFRVDLDTGQVTKMATGVGTPRKRAPLVATGGGGAIVTGGVSLSTPVTLQTAELYDPALGDFDGRPITLQKQRSDHAAVLLASGDVLLVGGQSGGTLAPELELVHLQTRTSELLPLQLAEPRTRPIALRLADGTVLVGGGYRADGTPAGSLELVSADGRSFARASQPIAMRARHGIVALDGGGALVVNVPGPGDGPTFQNAWNLTPEGALSPVTSILAITDAKLFPGADGHPVLWAGDRWLQLDPWSATQTWTAIDANSGAPGPAQDSPTVSPDPGLLAWIAGDGSVMLRRLSTRNVFATDPQPYLAASKDHLVPDRWSPTMTFDTSLFLPASTGAFVADARFLDVTVDVDAPSDGLPQIVLRGESGAEVDVGGASCPLVAPPLPAHLHVERRGGQVTYRLGTATDSPATPCGSAAIGASERIAVGLRAAAGPARAKSLRILR
ncbi:MAG TPA: hypothetical protein VLM85_04870 [Polyangiaceae bacterium]|nr:hypothetical protein [Polyangiaceae bacterium]